MQGRWTIQNRAPYIDGPSIFEPVPVVPCDDAAIERVAKALVTCREPDRHDLAPDEYDYANARAVLRAAGETP